MAMSMQTKDQLRETMKKLRAALSATERDKLSTAACHNLAELLDKLGQPKRAILGYLALPGELNIDQLLYSWKGTNYTVGIPVVSGSELIPCLLPAPDEMRRGRFNLREPLPEKVVALPLAEIGCIIMPGLAFDRRGYRLGYGKGYYDRFLSRFTIQPLLVGMAFDFQLCDHIPADAHDIPVDYLVTPSGSFQTSKLNAK